uniref:Uncharacterized protein n=1 Tax=Knipowitschia caucasica TaxID=637954 RepID=A0AAV2IWV8_KNICA
MQLCPPHELPFGESDQSSGTPPGPGGVWWVAALPWGLLSGLGDRRLSPPSNSSSPVLNQMVRCGDTDKEEGGSSACRQSHDSSCASQQKDQDHANSPLRPVMSAGVALPS